MSSKSIHMSDPNHYWLKVTSAKLGMSMEELLNSLISTAQKYEGKNETALGVTSTQDQVSVISTMSFTQGRYSNNDLQQQTL